MFGAASLTNDDVRAAAEGSKYAHARIIEAVDPQVRVMVLGRLNPAPNQVQDVDGIRQEVLLALIEGIPRLENRTVRGLTAYLSRIVGNKVADYIRRRKLPHPTLLPPFAPTDHVTSTIPQARLVLDWLSAHGTKPPWAAARRELVEKVWATLPKLTDKQRCAFILTFADQLTPKEIAKRCGIELGAASNLIMRAKEAIRSNLLP